MREHTNIRESGGFIQEREGRSCKDRGEGRGSGRAESRRGVGMAIFVCWRSIAIL